MGDIVKKSTLRNGVRVITKKLPYVRSVSMGVWVNVGARDERLHENGLSHFIEHMLFKGTSTRSAYQLAKEFDAIGGHTNAFTSMENTCYHARVLDIHLEAMVDMLSDIFLNSLFDPAEVENERPVILSEISMLEDSPEDFVHTLLEENYWRDHPLGRSILGSRENVLKFDADKIESFFNKSYQPCQTIISAAGNIDHDHLISLIGPAFEAIEAGKPTPERISPEAHTHTRFHTRELEQVHLCVGNKGLSITDPSRFSCSLMNTILGGNMSSRLFQEVREKRGLAYSIYSFSSLNVDSGLFGTYTGVAPENAHKATELILKEIDTLCQVTVEENELQDAKDYTKGNILLSSESTDNQMVRLAQNEIHFGRYIPVEETIENINKVTPDDIRILANRLFKESRPSLTVLGPVKNTESLESFMSTFI